MTELADSMADKQYSMLDNVNDRLTYVQCYNMSDGKDKIRFTAKSVNLEDDEGLFTVIIQNLRNKLGI